jgi:hypothetical protein
LDGTAGTGCGKSRYGRSAAKAAIDFEGLYGAAGSRTLSKRVWIEFFRSLWKPCPSQTYL